ncbi:cell division protein FtsQ [Natronincola peptidivorans]|uniref:Cell division protein FtsQ n=1 Tax=Natronincola peptidivorans TaxID=426128 RepID=A0A1H9Y735_9FIRM|nr:FtsQ-type POTRA domain-containing protein [Natronincola peptidivorans]SES64713.1 cell division protein FtsQ [Natronincola peptidivorans]
MEYTEIKREKKRRRRKIRKILTGIFLIMVFILWSVYFLLKSDLFNLKIISIEGNKTLAEEEIIEMAELYTNRNIYQYSLSDLQAKVKSHPFVEDAIIKRKIPKTIIITVREREKYAIIPYMGTFIYIDHNKVVLKISDSYLEEDLILITGVDFNSFKLGDVVDIKNPQLLSFVMGFIEASKMTSIIDRISEINIGQEAYIKLITFDGIEILLADTQDPAYSTLALKEVLTNLYTRDIKNVIVDMRYKGQISIRNREHWEED